jgi:EF hand
MDQTPKISNTATVPRSLGMTVPPPPPMEPPSSKSTAKLPRPHWVCRTRYFQTLCDQAFALIDSDGSGCVDEKELYTGLLLIHLQLGMYAGPAACKPLSRERVHSIFLKMDMDRSGTLQKDEFERCMAVLFGNVVLRVMVQWALTLLIVPWLAQFIVKSVILRTIQFIYSVITNLDEHSRFFQWIELTLEGMAEYIYETLLPSWVISVGLWIGRLLAAVPSSVWSILPITVVSTVLGMLVVPYCIYQVDDFFQRLADRHARKVK